MNDKFFNNKRMQPTDGQGGATRAYSTQSAAPTPYAGGLMSRGGPPTAGQVGGAAALPRPAASGVQQQARGQGDFVSELARSGATPEGVANHLRQLLLQRAQSRGRGPVA